VAEICAAALVNYFGIETKSSFENSVSYVQNWIDALKKDINMAYYAAIAAEKAFNYIVGCVDEKKEKEAA
jgi:antirestriction protein ArdC